MADTSAVAHQGLWFLAEKLLDWPVLLFILALILLYRSGSSIDQLFKSRKIEVFVGGNKLSIGDAVEALDEETKQAFDDFRKNREELDLIQSRLETLEVAIGNSHEVAAAAKAAAPNERSASAENEPPVAQQPSEAMPRAAAEPNREDKTIKRLRAALADSRFRWRSVERLAIEAGVTEREAHRILSDNPDQFILGKGKSGRTIARLPDR